MADGPEGGFGLSDILWFVSDISRIVSDNPKATLFQSCNWVAGTGPSSQANKGCSGMKTISIGN